MVWGTLVLGEDVIDVMTDIPGLVPVEFHPRIPSWAPCSVIVS